MTGFSLGNEVLAVKEVPPWKFRCVTGLKSPVNWGRGCSSATAGEGVQKSYAQTLQAHNNVVRQEGKSNFSSEPLVSVP